MKYIFAFALCCVPSIVSAQYPADMRYDRQAVQTDDEYALADRLYARYLQRQAEAMRLQAEAAAVEVSNQRLRSYVCQRFCGGMQLPAARDYQGIPAGYGSYPLSEPMGYGAVAVPRPMAAGVYGVRVEAGGLRYPW